MKIPVAIVSKYSSNYSNHTQQSEFMGIWLLNITDLKLTDKVIDKFDIIEFSDLNGSETIQLYVISKLDMLEFRVIVLFNFYSIQNAKLMFEELKKKGMVKKDVSKTSP